MGKKVCFGCLLLALLGILLFPKQILLRCIAWKAVSYCQEAFEAKLEVEELVWKEGKILLKRGRLHKMGELNASFEQATLIPFLDWRKRAFGGELNVQKLKIVHCKKESRPIPTPPPPSFKFLNFHLDTTVEGGELLLYDYLAKTQFFQQVHFDLSHHVHGKEAEGRISFEWNPDTPPFIAHFHSFDEERLDLTVHLERHSFPVLSHLVTYFFQRYLPEPIYQWDIHRGTVDGDLAVVLVEGAPLVIKGKVDLNRVCGENIPLEMRGELDHLSCDLDVDFSNVETIQGQFELQGGKLSLEPNGELWRGLCEVEDVNATICVNEGKVASSTLRGNWMGMEGEVVLDWKAHDILMEMGFWGASDGMISRLPQKMQAGFAAAFPQDYFTLDATLARLEKGLELRGDLSIVDNKSSVYKLAFGCLLGDKECEKESLPLTQSVDDFLDHLKGQFCLSQKRFGWFQGEGFPLEKFLTPFLLRDVRMVASGKADFKGTFDEHFLVVFYEGKDFCVESPHFKFQVERVKEHLASEISAVHYLDLKTWEHVGYLPIKEADYWQKNYNFHLQHASTLIHFENNTIHFQEIATQGEGLDFQGDVDLIVHSPEDVEMTIAVEQLHGSVRAAQQFLAHFKPSVLWEIPVEGEVVGMGEPLFFQYHFSPTAHLLSGRVHGEIHCLPFSFLSDQRLKALIDYDCKTMDLACQVIENELPLITLQATTRGVAGGKEVKVKGTGPAPYDLLDLTILQNEAEGKNSLQFVCGPWSGAADVSFLDRAVYLNRVQCSSTQNRGFSFSGVYEKQAKCVRGELREFKWDVTSFLEKYPIPWKHQGVIAGSGPLMWNLGDGVCSVEGLGVEISTEEGIEKYQLGRIQYAAHQQKIHFEGFDFALSPEKLSWATQMAGIDSALIDGVKGLKQSGPIEGHLSLEVYPDNVWVWLNLKDGAYQLAGNTLHLQNFRLAYDPYELNIWTQCCFRDNYYWLHLLTDSLTMQQGILELSQYELSPDICEDELLTARWKREEKGLRIKSVGGTLCGMEVALSDFGLGSEAIALAGHIGFDPARIAPLLDPLWQEKIKSLAIAGECGLEGCFTLNRERMSDFSFSGTLFGTECQAAGIGWAEFSSQLELTPKQIKFSQCSCKDWAGELILRELILSRQEERQWHLDLDHLAVSGVRFSRLKSPWTNWSPRDKPFLRNLVIRSFVLDQCSGELKDLTTLLGQGKVEFTNLPKKTLLSNLLFIPSEITARIGLDLSALVPARGIVEYSIEDGRIHLSEFKEMYSDGKLSRFYLAEGFLAYIDFQGNLNMKVKMKQYNLLMKLAEFFTVTVKGTLLRPSYTFSNHVDPDD